MFQVTREIDFCYGHRLLNYEGKCKYLHGHNGRVVITIEAEKLDHRGMVRSSVWCYWSRSSGRSSGRRSRSRNRRNEIVMAAW